MPIDSGHELEWIAGLQAGRLDIFREIFDAYAPPLRRFARVWTPRDVAEDIVQDIFFDIWQRREKLDFQGTSLGAYLFSAVRNQALKYLRHRGVEVRTEQDGTFVTPPGMSAEIPAPDAQVIAKELSTAIRAAIAPLPEIQKAVLLLRWTQGLSYAQIATTLSISENAAMLHVSRAKRVLQPLFSKVLEDFQQ